MCGCLGVHWCVWLCVRMCVCVPGCVLVMHWHIKTANLKMKTAPAMCCGGCNCSPSTFPQWGNSLPHISASYCSIAGCAKHTHMLLLLLLLPLPHAETKVKFSGCNYRAISAEFPFTVCYTASASPCNLPHFCGTQGWHLAKIQSLNSKVWCSIAVEQQE